MHEVRKVFDKNDEKLWRKVEEIEAMEAEVQELFELALLEEEARIRDADDSFFCD